MPLPTSIVIGGKTWAVEVVPWLWREKRCAGECLRHKRRILVGGDQSEDEQFSTLWHEAIHAAFPQTVVDSEVEERIVKRLEWRLRKFACFAEGCGRRR
jgi:hypothetical protein